MKDTYIKMHGLDLGGSGEVVEEDVHINNVTAFERSGWRQGALEKEWSTIGVTYTEDEDKAHISTTSLRCKFIKPNKEQCGNDAVKDSEFCFIKGHK